MNSYHPGFLAPADAGDLFSWLQREVPWREESVVLFGQRRTVPRLVAWFGDEGLNYRYSGQSHQGTGWPARLSGLRTEITSHLGAAPNFLLLNRYRDGSDSMGWHRDDESGHEARIASVSLGASRSFLLREDDASRSRSLTLDHGSLLLFDGRTRHSLPKTRKPIGERINLTFRVLLPQRARARRGSPQ